MDKDGKDTHDELVALEKAGPAGGPLPACCSQLCWQAGWLAAASSAHGWIAHLLRLLLHSNTTLSTPHLQQSHVHIPGDCRQTPGARS